MYELEYDTHCYYIFLTCMSMSMKHSVFKFVLLVSLSMTHSACLDELEYDGILCEDPEDVYDAGDHPHLHCRQSLRLHSWKNTVCTTFDQIYK